MDRFSLLARINSHVREQLNKPKVSGRRVITLRAAFVQKHTPQERARQLQPVSSFANQEPSDLTDAVVTPCLSGNSRLLVQPDVLVKRSGEARIRQLKGEYYRRFQQQQIARATVPLCLRGVRKQDEDRRASKLAAYFVASDGRQVFVDGYSLLYLQHWGVKWDRATAGFEAKPLYPTAPLVLWKDKQPVAVLQTENWQCLIDPFTSKGNKHAGVIEKP